MVTIPLYSQRPTKFQFVQAVNAIQMWRSGASDKVCVEHFIIYRLMSFQHLDDWFCQHCQCETLTDVESLYSYDIIRVVYSFSGASITLVYAKASQRLADISTLSRKSLVWSYNTGRKKLRWWNVRRLVLWSLIWSIYACNRAQFNDDERSPALGFELINKNIHCSWNVRICQWYVNNSGILSLRKASVNYDLCYYLLLLFLTAVSWSFSSISGDAGSNPAAPITYWAYSLIGRIPDGKLPVQLIAVNI